MKRPIFNLRRPLVATIAVLVTGVLFSSCLKDSDENDRIPTAGLLAVNLAPDQQSLAITLSGNFLTQTPLAYTNYTGGYQRVYTGTRSINAYDYPDSNPLSSSSQLFEADNYYSLYFIGYNGKYRNVISEDLFDSLSANSGNAYVRYVNAIADSAHLPQVVISSNGNAVISETGNYATVSTFKAISPGNISIAVNSAAGVDTSRSFSVSAKKVYTVLLTGIPGASDPDKRVQVKFIENGTLTDENGNN